MAKYIIASTRLNDDGSVHSVSHPIEVDSDTINTVKILDKTYILEKHGQWLSIKVMDDEADFGETDGAECSVCGYTTNSEYWAKTYYHYCPNCGAKMDLDEVEE